MSTGPEHYRTAEELLDIANDYDEDGAPATAKARRDEALVRATLALADAVRAGTVPLGQVLVDQCRVAESAHGRQCVEAAGHDGGHDFGDGEVNA